MTETENVAVGPKLSRRGWLGVAAGMGLGSACISVRADDPALSPDEARARDEVVARARIAYDGDAWVAADEFWNLTVMRTTSFVTRTFEIQIV